MASDNGLFCMQLADQLALRLHHDESVRPSGHVQCLDLLPTMATLPPWALVCPTTFAANPVLACSPGFRSSVAAWITSLLRSAVNAFATGLSNLAADSAWSVSRCSKFGSLAPNSRR